MAGSLQHFDGLALAAVVAELAAYGEARIDKVGQPSAHELCLQLRAGGTNLRLYVNLQDQWARMHLVTRALGNVPVPAGFTMQLRKHLEGSRLLRVEQPGLERVVRLVVAGRDELGDPYERHLVLELIGKFANAFLVDARQDTILGCLRPVTEAMCQVRQLGPGLPYDPPPAPVDKIPFMEADAAAVLVALGMAPRVSEALVAGLAGLSRLSARQLLEALGVDPGLAVASLTQAERDALVAAVLGVRDRVRAGRFWPRATAEGWALWWAGPGEPPVGPGASAVLEAYFGGRQAATRLAERRRVLGREVAERERRLTERLATWEEALAKAEGADRHRELGDLLAAHMHLLRPGLEALEVEDWFGEAGGRVTIPLDPRLTPSENIQRCFRRYQKARNGRRAATELLATGREEAAYMASVVSAVALAPELADLEEIAQELGLVKAPVPRRGQAAPTPQPLRLVSSDGLPLLVGKNNRQNEFVTFQAAHAGDWWLHTQGIPGAHVVIRTSDEVPTRSLHEAATLAAWFSQARESSRVPVVYTRRRHVKKPRGARPGMVIYEQERTLFVTPDPAVVDALLQTQNARS
jgi:predicted ribosome quality control (RQC) complex YloA/Tae2 family protein